MLNHTQDPDLKRLIERSIKDIKEPTGQQVRELLTNEGVPMPQTARNKAKANPTDVPPGDRLLVEDPALPLWEQGRRIVGAAVGRPSVEPYIGQKAGKPPVFSR